MNGDVPRSYPMVETFFIGGAGDEVTGSQTLLKIINSDGEVHFGMVDCGAVQGDAEYMNYDYPICGKNIEFVLLTHAHYDHIGDLPLLYKSGFRGKIYATSVAKKLIYPNLIDAAKIQESKCMDTYAKNLYEKATKKINMQKLGNHSYKEQRDFDAALSQLDESEFAPLFTVEDVENVMELIIPVEAYTKIHVCDGADARFMPTTHQNGAARIEVYMTDTGKTGGSYVLAFSGDIGPNESLLYHRGNKYYNKDVDGLVLETLHGTERMTQTLGESISVLNKILKSGIKQHKHIVLVGFSLDRNAMLVYLLKKLLGNRVELVIDSILTMKQLRTYQLTYNSGDRTWFKDLGLTPFDTDNFNVISSGRRHIESVLHGEAPRVIITASANGGGGRIVNYYANCIQRSDYIFVINGWVSPDSPSGILLATKVGDFVEINGDKYRKHCTTYQLHGFTSHGGFEEMKEIVRDDYPSLSTLILNHARTDAKKAVKDEISHYCHADIKIPENLDAYRLTKNGAELLTDSECLIEFDSVLDLRNISDGEGHNYELGTMMKF